MKIITQPSLPIEGIISSDNQLALPGDKSLSHRAALFAALASGQSVIDNFQNSGVTEVMLKALGQLGIQWSINNKTLTVNSQGLSNLKTPANAIFCGNSATTMRLLAGALTGANVNCVLTGSDGLSKRPMKRIVEPLRQMGLEISSGNTALTAPLHLKPSGKVVDQITIHLQIASAQVKSCLLLAALGQKIDLSLSEPGPSRDHTERMLKNLGIPITTWINEKDSATQYWTRIQPNLSDALPPLKMKLPGDISAAAFLISAALILPGSKLVLENVGLNPTRTGIIQVFKKMGGNIQITDVTDTAGEPTGTITVTASELNGIEISGETVVKMIDEFPALSAAAVYAKGTTVVRDAEELRHKESDRISRLCQELKKLGAQVEEQPDGFIITGQPQLKGGIVTSHGDHRLAMALTIAGLRTEKETVISQAEMIRESFPNFLSILISLGAKFQEEI
jgi:3-phosphoshikimate 1-carboxyvinyltransferase